MLFLLWVCGQCVCVVQAKRHIHSVRRHPYGTPSHRLHERGDGVAPRAEEIIRTRACLSPRRTKLNSSRTRRQKGGEAEWTSGPAPAPPLDRREPHWRRSAGLSPSNAVEIKTAFGSRTHGENQESRASRTPPRRTKINDAQVPYRPEMVVPVPSLAPEGFLPHRNALSANDSPAPNTRS